MHVPHVQGMAHSKCRSAAAEAGACRYFRSHAGGDSEASATPRREGCPPGQEGGGGPKARGGCALSEAEGTAAFRRTPRCFERPQCDCLLDHASGCSGYKGKPSIVCTACRKKRCSTSSARSSRDLPGGWPGHRRMPSGTRRCRQPGWPGPSRCTRSTAVCADAPGASQ